MKQLGQRAIRDLVAQRPIRTQQELAAALRDAARTTQATISRDAAELSKIKVGREGTPAYALPPVSSRPKRPGRTASASSSSTCRSRYRRPACC